jgi:hypothetical protein
MRLVRDCAGFQSGYSRRNAISFARRRSSVFNLVAMRSNSSSVIGTPGPGRRWARDRRRKSGVNGEPESAIISAFPRNLDRAPQYRFSWRPAVRLDGAIGGAGLAIGMLVEQLDDSPW